jgi:hypothetical protein
VRNLHPIPLVVSRRLQHEHPLHPQLDLRHAGYADLMDERDSDPGTLLADKGYDSDAIRPGSSGSRRVPQDTDQEQPLSAVFSRKSCLRVPITDRTPQGAKRIAIRQNSNSLIGFVLLGCIRIWIRFVHRA